MGKKKCLIFVTQLLETGGIESHIKEFCFQMQDDQIEFSLLVLNSNTNNETTKQFVDSCKSVWLINSRNSILRHFKLLFILLIINTKQFEILYTNGQGNSILFIRKVIFNIKNWVHHHHTSGDTSDQKTWTKNYIKAMQNADFIIACANYNAFLLADVLKRKVYNIPCFSRKIEIKNLPINPQKIKIAYYGRLIKEKGIEAICKLSNEKEFSNIEFHIWGKSSYFNETFFTQFKNLKYMGSFEGINELKQTIYSIDAFILYSTHPEGLPISLLEIMSAGKPWIASNIGGVSELSIQSELNYLLPIGTTYDELKVHIKKFLNNLVELSNISDLQKQIYNERYSANIIKQDWKRVLNSLKI